MQVKIKTSKLYWLFIKKKAYKKHKIYLKTKLPIYNLAFNLNGILKNNYKFSTHFTVKYSPK